MKKVITLVLYNRPDYTRRVLAALRACDGVGNYLILPHVEPGNDEVLALAEKIDFAQVKLTLNPRRLGIGRNTWLAWNHGFQEADFIVHLEDDTVPARDCLRFMEHCRRAYLDDPEIFSVAAYHRSPCARSRFHEISRRRYYTCWLVGLWKNRWQWCQSRWHRDSSQYAAYLNHLLGEHGLKEVYPLLSRAQNIGAENGTFVPSADWHRRHHHTKFWAGRRTLPGKFSEAPPLVTAVMITGMHPARYDFARVAIKCFKKQTYPNKELLIINHGTKSLADGDGRLRQVRVRKKKSETVGDLRNLGLAHAAGDFVISWDDDDWHHPRRIETQMNARRDGAAVLLKNRIHHNFQNGSAGYDRADDGAPATILHPRDVPFRYPSLTRGSDSVFAQHFKTRVAVENDAALYLRFFHGLNLWGARHIMGAALADPAVKNQLEISPQHRRLLARVLRTYLGCAQIQALSQPTQTGQKASPTPATRNSGGDGFNLLISMYPEADAQHREELFFCLEKNLRLSWIRKIYNFDQGRPDLRQPLLRHEKIEHRPIRQWPTFKMFFDFANAELPGQKVIIANADIFFDCSLSRLKNFDLAGKVLALTRHDLAPSPNRWGDVWRRSPKSQDAWIFRAPLNPTFADIKMGWLGCDNWLAYELDRAGLVVLNPSLTIMAWHVHTSRPTNPEGRPPLVGSYHPQIRNRHGHWIKSKFPKFITLP